MKISLLTFLTCSALAASNSPLAIAGVPGSVTNDVASKLAEVGRSGNVRKIAGLLPEIEALWPQQPVSYFQCVRQAAALVEAEWGKHPEHRALLATLFTNMTSKPVPAETEQAIACFEAKDTAAMTCSYVVEASGDKTLLMAFAGVVGEVRLRRIVPAKGGSPNRVPARILALRAAGTTSPDHITNEVWKSAYQAAVEEDRLHSQSNRLQQVLWRMDAGLSRAFLNIVHGAASGPQNKEFIETISATAHLTEDERKKFR